MKTQIERLEAIKELVDLGIEGINKKVLIGEEKAYKAIELISKTANEFPLVSLSIKEDSTVAYYVKEEIKLFILPTYQSEFKAYTSRFSAKHKLYYTVRDNIYGWFPLLNAKIEKDKIVMQIGGEYSYKSPWSKNEEVSHLIIKEFKNGNVQLKKDESLLKLIELVQYINEKLTK